MALVKRQDDTLDKMLVFLAKHDGIDKLVKTFQYVFKLANWRLMGKYPDLARRAKLFEDACGLSRKAFRTGRFLNGFNSVRKNQFKDLPVSILTLLGGSGEMVYFFFDHFAWMSRVGLLDAKLATRFAYISAYGECLFYLSYMSLDGIMLHRDALVEQKLREKLRVLEENLPPTITMYHPQLTGGGEKGKEKENEAESSRSLVSLSLEQLAVEAEFLRKAICDIQRERVSRLLSIAAQFSDLLIALALVEPRPVYSNPLTLGISGLVSAWSGWYRLWPA